jgi:ATP-dependent DNA helicase RecG
MNIADILNQPEGKTLEFKQDLSSPINILKTIIAFANSAGGVLIIGVEDGTKKIINIENPLDEEERLTNLIADSIEPRLVPNVELVSYQESTLLVVEVFPSTLRPHFLHSLGELNGVFVRLGSSNRLADAELIRELKRSTTNITFDEQIFPGLSGDSLDVDAIKKIFGSHRDISESDLVTLYLLNQHQGQLAPTIGGILLFGINREQTFPDSWIQCGRFIGKDKANIFDHIEIHEHLPLAVEKVMDFLKKHAMKGADFTELKRKDIWSIPLTMLREAVVNAIVHADYAQKGSPLRIAFFDDRIEIENPGILLPGMTIEDMMEGVSKIRNRVIARVFKELGLIEQWGSGMLRIFKEAKDLKLPKPLIQEIGMKVRITIYLSQSLSVVSNIKRAESGAESGAESILILLKNIPLSAAEIAKASNRNMVTGALKRLLRLNLEAGFIEMTIPDKPNSRLQKYKLTNKGRNILK